MQQFLDKYSGFHLQELLAQSGVDWLLGEEAEKREKTSKNRTTGGEGGGGGVSNGKRHPSSHLLNKKDSESSIHSTNDIQESIGKSTSPSAKDPHVEGPAPPRGLIEEAQRLAEDIDDAVFVVFPVEDEGEVEEDSLLNIEETLTLLKELTFGIYGCQQVTKLIFVSFNI